MKLLAKIGIALLVTGVAATMYAAPNDTLSAATDAGGLKEQAHSDLKHVRQLQQLARKQKDVIKLNCVNDKLVQLKPLMNVVDKQYEAWGQASDKQSTVDEMGKTAAEIRRLRAEADQCVGEVPESEDSNSFTGPDVPDDPTKQPFPPTGPIEPPGYASPYN